MSEVREGGDRGLGCAAGCATGCATALAVLAVVVVIIGFVWLAGGLSWLVG